LLARTGKPDQTRSFLGVDYFWVGRVDQRLEGVKINAPPAMAEKDEPKKSALEITDK
jgi:hypothetical protein